MNYKEYLNSYIEQSNIENKKPQNPNWMKAFFKEFSEELKSRTKNNSKGDRYIVTGSFSKAFHNLIPNGIKWNKEIQFKKLVEINDKSELDKMLQRKRVDYVIYCKEKTVLIEFKTNLQFNDLSAAMIELGAVKKYSPITSIKQFETSSLHLFPNNVNIAGLKELNKKFDSPLDNIWVFCKGPKLEFEVSEIERFRNNLMS